jgi:DNA primase
MGILDEDVARVREGTDFVALASEHMALRRVGRRYVGLCPFHQEKTPSFSINPELGLFKCFGCGVGGDAITFVREIEHLDFVDAVERLAARIGITLRYDDARAGESRTRKARLTEAVGAAIEFYHHRLLESPEAGKARKYLRDRGFDGDAVRRFKLGWAPDDWDSLSRQLQKDRFSRDDLVEAGLAFVNRANRLQDQFRSRLMFPIYDARGEPAGFGGRIVDGEGPKYKNSPDNALYRKSSLLYGLNWAKADIVSRDEVVICEGYTDVMAFALSDVPNAVATCGTALTDDHVRALKNLARRVVLAYDTDAAGQNAAEQWFRWEHEFEIQLRVADLPPGLDPADVWRESPERLRAAVEHATPFLQFRIDRLLGAIDLTSLEGRGRAGEAAAALVAEHPSELVRDQYVMQLAAKLEIDADTLRRAVARGPRPGRVTPSERPRPRRPDTPPEEAPRPRPVTVDRRELDLLRWVIHEPELVAGWIEPVLFADPTARAAFEVLADAPTFRDALDAAPAEIHDLLERLAVDEPVILGEPDALETRLLVNSVAPRAEHLVQRLLAAGDARVSDLKRDLDVLVEDREAGYGQRARDAALRLVTLLVQFDDRA